MFNVVLASGPITNTDSLVIELVVPLDAPPAVMIRWPGCAIPSVWPTIPLPAAALAAIALLDDAMQELIRQDGQPR